MMAWQDPVYVQLWDVPGCPGRSIPGHFCTKVCADAYGGLPLNASAPTGWSHGYLQPGLQVAQPSLQERPAGYTTRPDAAKDALLFLCATSLQ
jgi:hypothetical protein